MNPDEAMDEIREWLDDDSSRRLGKLWRVDEWLLETTDEYGTSVEDETARHYAVGWLQKWFYKNSSAVPWRLVKDVRESVAIPHFLVALWLAYKAVEKIKVTKCSGLNGS